MGLSRKSYGLYPCVIRVRGQQQQCWKRCENDPTLWRYASAITDQKKCWDGLLLAQTFDRFQTLRNNSQQHAATYNNIQHYLQTTQHVTFYNVGSCWPAMFRPFARGLTFLSLKTYLYPVSFSCPKSARKPENAGRYGIYANNGR